MKSDLDRHMANRNLDVLFVSGGTRDNPPMYYLTNGAKVGEQTLLVKKRGEEPVLIAIGMEREEAAKSGLQVVDRSRYKLPKLIREEEGNQLAAHARMIAAIFDDLGVSGNVGVYGRAEQGQTMALFTQLARHLTDVNFVGEASPNLFDLAQQTKDLDEVVRIRQVAASALTVVGNTRDFLASHTANNGTLVRRDGSTLTIGDVKREIRRWTFEQNLGNPQGMVFAIGRDAAVPHSRGADADPIALGQTIVFDYFPCEAGGGYFYDFTRTWCIGYAPLEVERTYQDVHAALELAIDSLYIGQPCREAQRKANDFFESRGHPTTRSHPGTAEGYVHSLGHGLGLSVHEYPKLSDTADNNAVLQPSMVLTVEPGLYYPDRGYGIRIEETVWIKQEKDGAEVIGEFDKELVIQVTV